MEKASSRMNYANISFEAVWSCLSGSMNAPKSYTFLPSEETSVSMKTTTLLSSAVCEKELRILFRYSWMLAIDFYAQNHFTAQK